MAPAYPSPETVPPRDAPTAGGERRAALWTGLAVGLGFALLQLLLVLQPQAVELDPEELYNAGHALAVRELGPAALLPLQYRPFCGGCTLDAGLGAALLLVLPPSLLTWKLVPIGLGAVVLGLLAAAVRRELGAVAAACLAAVLLLTPPVWARMALVGWGNHYEAGLFVLLGLALMLPRRPLSPRRALLLGVVLGAGVQVGFSAAFALPVACGWLLLRCQGRMLPLLFLGAAAGFSPALLRWAMVGESPLSTIYEAGERLPLLSRVPHKLSTLLPPRQLAGLVGVRHPLVGPVVGLAAAASLLAASGLAVRRPGAARVALALLGGWLAVYLLVRFQVSVAPPGVVPTAGDLRYAAPAVVLAAVLVALVAARAWSAGRRLLAALLLLPWLLPGAWGRLAPLTPPFPSTAAAHMRAADLEYFREQASWALPQALQQRALTGDGPLAPVAAYAAGRSAASRWREGPHVGRRDAALPLPALPTGLHPAWAEGVAAALTDDRDPDADGDRSSLEEAARLLLLAGRDWPAPVQQAALRATCWRRVDGGHADALLRGVDTEEGLRQLATQPAALAVDAQEQQAWRDALAFCAGRRWARDRAPRWTATEIVLPLRALGDTGWEEGFAIGLGRGLGEAWGPAAVASPPPALPAAWKTAYGWGVAAGLDRRWLLPSLDAPP